MRRACITGGAGFIGSNLADELITRGIEVVAVDNFVTGRRQFVEHLLDHDDYRLLEGDVHDLDLMKSAIDGCDWVFHLQANADVRHGLERPTVDLEQNTIATSVVLEAMRAVGTRQIAFSSTGSVYGEPEVFPTPENAPFPLQTSLYGASKVACEGLVSAYAVGYDFTAVIFRFVSILGERYTHGHVYDFYRSLQRDPRAITVLGDGKQEKSYLYVGDCVKAILLAADHHAGKPGATVYNLGTDETVVVDDSLAIIVDHMGLAPRVDHTGGRRGWTGDSPLIHLETTRIRSLGWAPQLSIPEAVRATLKWFDENPSVFDESPMTTSGGGGR